MGDVEPGPGFWDVPKVCCDRCGEQLSSPVHRCLDDVRHPMTLAALDALRRDDQRAAAFFLDTLPPDERAVVQAIIDHARPKPRLVEP